MLEGPAVNIAASVRWTFQVEGPQNADELEESAQKVMEALLELEACDSKLGNAGVAIDAHEMTVDVELSVEGASETEVVEHAQAAVRTAIHAAGHGTPDWPVSATSHKAVHGSQEPVRAAGTFRRQQFSINA